MVVKGLVACREKICVCVIASKGVVERRFEIWSSHTVDRLRGLYVGKGNLLRANTNHRPVLLVKIMDVESSVATQDFVL